MSVLRQGRDPASLEDKHTAILLANGYEVCTRCGISPQADVLNDATIQVYKAEAGEAFMAGNLAGACDHQFCAGIWC